MNRPTEATLLSLIDDLRGQVQRLSARVADLEQQRQTTAASAQAVPPSLTTPVPVAPAARCVWASTRLACGARYFTSQAL